MEKYVGSASLFRLFPEMNDASSKQLSFFGKPGHTSRITRKLLHFIQFFQVWLSPPDFFLAQSSYPYSRRSCATAAIIATSEETARHARERSESR